MLTTLFRFLATDPYGPVAGIACTLALPFTALVISHRLARRNRKP